MFAGPGALYVYRSYGIHWCANITCGPEGFAAAVLLRALEPTRGLDQMRVRRGDIDDRLLCSGPGRLTQALGIDGACDGLSVLEQPFTLAPPDTEFEIVTTPRIGITKAVEMPWRFVVSGSRWASRSDGRRPTKP
jgi:DNA-3-methyladenine glycosylase